MSTTERATVSPTRRSQYKAAFDHFDRNNDGTISVDELGTVMRECGKDPTEEELRDILNDSDLDGNKVLDFEEFLVMMEKKTKDDQMEEMKQGFIIFDRNGDGFISRTELRQGLENLSLTLTEKQLDEILTQVDVDKDGQINYSEFITFMMCNNV